MPHPSIEESEPHGAHLGADARPVRIQPTTMVPPRLPAILIIWPSSALSALSACQSSRSMSSSAASPPRSIARFGQTRPLHPYGLRLDLRIPHRRPRSVASLLRLAAYPGRLLVESLFRMAPMVRELAIYRPDVEFVHLGDSASMSPICWRRGQLQRPPFAPALCRFGHPDPRRPDTLR